MSAGPSLARLPHASLETDSRLRKAKKIAAIVRKRIALKGASVLEIGTGAGAMAAHFASLVGRDGQVVATDVHDQRLTREGFAFYQVDDVALPFADSKFDLVIYNHVIEHVGNRRDQAAHLCEIRRVLKPSGIAYIAAPNRWAVVEPHFRLAFLSWLPCSLRSAYVRLAKRGRRYDCDPLSHREFRQVLSNAGFVCEGCAAEAVAAMADFESHRAIVRMAARLPGWVLDSLHPVMATLIFVARK